MFSKLPASFHAYLQSILELPDSLLSLALSVSTPLSTLESQWSLWITDLRSWFKIIHGSPFYGSSSSFIPKFYKILMNLPKLASYLPTYWTSYFSILCLTYCTFYCYPTSTASDVSIYIYTLARFNFFVPIVRCLSGVSYFNAV